MNTRYTALPVIATLLKVIAFVVLVVGLINGVSYFTAFAGKPPEWTIWTSLIACAHTLGSAVVNVVLLLAASELIHVVLDIEENTRRSADTLAGGSPGTTPRA